jgi:hypothetical protein
MRKLERRGKGTETEDQEVRILDIGICAEATICL